MSLSGNSALSSIGSLYNIFSGRQKRQFGWLLVFTFFSSISDLVGLSFVIPVVGLVLSDTFHNTVAQAFPIIDHLSRESLLIWCIGVFFTLILLKNAFGLYINWLQVRFVRNLFVSSTMNVLGKIYKRPLLDLQKHNSNELVNKISFLQMALCSNAAISTIILINEAIVFSLTAIIVCLWDWKLFLLMIAVLAPTIGFFYAKVKNMIREAGNEKNKESIAMYARAQEMIVGYTDIKIAGTEQNFKQRYKTIAERYSGYQGKMDFMLFVPTRIIEVAIFLCIILILLYGVYVLKDTEKLITTITLFSVIAYRSIPSVNRFVMAMNNLNSNEFIMKDPDFMLDENANRNPEAPAMQLNDRITFSNVSYHYPESNKLVVKDCNMTIHKGEKIGIVGKSGAGKSTLINNILGFLSPTGGSISIDDVTLTPNNVYEWWKIVGYVRQEVFIMNATLMENIAIGLAKEEIDTERLQHALDMASLSSLVAEMPDGVHTMLNESGNNLSGGQKQRISIARAIYKGAQVLIFDEATSALDSKTEEEITNAIRQLGREDLTIIIIAHRYTSLKYCDKIYALHNGQIDQSLSYQELMEQSK